MPTETGSYTVTEVKAPDGYLIDDAERIVKVYGETDVPSEKRLKDKDKRRAAYYQFYTDRKWGDAAHYDVCLDSGTLGIDKCVDIITQLY